jgi:hypothetical protein
MSDDDEYIVKSCEPKSDQLNADDLVSGPRILTITGVKRGDAQQPVWIDTVETKPYKPSKGMRRVLVAAWGEHPRDWIGKRLEVYRDDAIMFGGVRVGGIRISAMSGIKADMTFLITTGKGKRTECTVKKLTDKPATSEPPQLTDSEQAYVADATNEIAAADSLDTLRFVWSEINKDSSEAVKATLAPLKDKRKADLS